MGANVTKGETPMLQTPSPVFAALAALVLVIGLASPADAKHRHDGNQTYWKQQSAKYGHYDRHGRKHESRKRYGDHGRYGHYRYYGQKPRHKPQGHAYGSYGRYPANACQRVAKHGYWHGRAAKIGGLRCFDRYGRAYIKPGSHHVIRYYAPGFVFSGPGFSFYWR